jgi:hypothetical protein
MKFVILIKGEDKWAELSPAQMQEGLQKYQAFAARLREEGRYVDAEGLDAKIVSIGSDGVVTDGPFAETKELVGGYYVFTAADWEEATAIAKDCPALQYGGAIELRAQMSY